MRKVICLLLASVMSLALIGCGNSGGAAESSAKSENTSKSEAESSAPSEKSTDVVDFSTQKKMGSGKFYVITQAGSSKDVDAPVIYIDPDEWDQSVGIEAWDFNGSKLTYLYIDGELADKSQLSNDQTSLVLTDAGKKVGKHIISAVQYDTDKPGGKIVTYKSAIYEAKSQ